MSGEVSLTRHVSSDEPRVLVVDGSRVVRQLIERVLKTELPNAVVIGCGSIGQGILPLIRRHVTLDGDRRLVVLSADEQGRKLARDCGAHFEHAHLTPGNHRRILNRHVAAGDLLLNLSVNVSSLDLIRYCASEGVLYVDTSIEPWPGVFDNPMLDLRQRTNYLTRQRALQLATELGPESPTAIVDHGDPIT